jgi:uncharacterized protein (TIGR03067 family)
MKVRLLCVVLTALVLAADADDAKKELAKLAGTWSAVSIERDGKAMPADKLKSSTLTITGDKYVVKMGELMIEGVYKLDPAQKPKAIDATRTNGDDKGKTLLGIYALEGDELKMCFNGPDVKERPKEFGAKSGSGTALYVFKRGK